jgi:hypothetical protein
MPPKNNPGATREESEYEMYYDAISYIYGFEKSITINAPLWNLVFLIMFANVGWMVIRKKFKLLWLPTNTFMVLAINLWIFLIFVLDLVPVNLVKENKKPTPKEAIGLQIIGRMEHFLGPDLVYKFALPFIVIGEAFAAGPNSYVFTFKSVVKVQLKVFSIVLAIGFLFFYSSSLASNFIDGQLHVFHTLLEAMLFAAFLIPNVYGEGLDALEDRPNAQVELCHLERTYLRNNAALIIVATLERYKARMISKYGPTGATMWDTNEAFVSIFWCGFGSIIYGWLVSFVIIKFWKTGNHALNGLEITSTVIFGAFVIYGTCHMQGLALSGDVAVIIYAFTIRNYGLLNFGNKIPSTVNIVIIFIKEIAEQMVFMSMALFALTFYISHIEYNQIAYAIILSTIYHLVFVVVGLLTYWINRNDEKLTIWEELFLTSAQFIKGDLSFALFGSTIFEDWNLTLAVLIYSIILFSYMIWTPIHYFMGKYILLKDCDAHVGYVEELKRRNEYEITSEGEIKVDMANPKITSFLRYMVWYPMFVKGYKHSTCWIRELADEIHEDLEKVEGEEGSEGSEGMGSDLSHGDDETDQLTHPMEIELVTVDRDISDAGL